MADPQPIEIDGHAFASLREAVRHFGISLGCLQRRLANGFTFEQALKSIGTERVYNRKTHCKRGHEFTDENTRIFDQNGYISRQCRACANERQKRLSKHRWTWSDA